MMAETDCDGVVVGRGCLGRPWLFGDLAAAFDGRTTDSAPPVGRVVDAMRDHARRLVEWHGETVGVRDLRKHVGWYLRGYPAGSEVRSSLARVATLAELDEVLAPLADGPHADALPDDADGARGRQGSPGKVVLPEGWLDDPEDETVPEGADLMHSGG